MTITTYKNEEIGKITVNKINNDRNSRTNLLSIKTKNSFIKLAKDPNNFTPVNKNINNLPKKIKASTSSFYIENENDNTPIEKKGVIDVLTKIARERKERGSSICNTVQVTPTRGSSCCRKLMNNSFGTSSKSGKSNVVKN